MVLQGLLRLSGKSHVNLQRLTRDPTFFLKQNKLLGSRIRRMTSDGEEGHAMLLRQVLVQLVCPCAYM